MVRSIGCANAVERYHYGKSAAFVKTAFEAAQVGLTELLFIHINGYTRTIVLLVVEADVLRPARKTHFRRAFKTVLVRFIGYLYGGGYVAFVGIVNFYCSDFLVVIKVRKAVTESVNDFVVIVPSLARGGTLCGGCILGEFVVSYTVVIPGFIVLIANVDALCLYYILCGVIRPAAEAAAA